MFVSMADLAITKNGSFVLDSISDVKCNRLLVPEISFEGAKPQTNATCA